MKQITTVTLLWLCLGTQSSAQHPLDDLEEGHWMVLSENTMSDFDPCPTQDCAYSGAEGQSGAVDDWVGAAFATEHGALGSLVVWGGGHGGYWGSEVYVFDVDTRLWSRVSDPYPNGNACDMDTGLYPDGSPCPAHTYDAVEYHPGTNSFVTLAAETNHMGGYFNDTPSMFDLGAGTWRQGCQRPDGRGITGAASAYDATRDLIWFIGAYNQRVASYDVDTCTWTAYEQYNVDIDVVAAIDPGRDLLVTIDGRGTQTVFVHDLADPGAGGVTITTTGDLEAQNQGANGFEWDPITEQFVAYVDGASVYTLRPPAGAWETEPWTWTRIDPAPTSTVVPSANGNGTYSRFRYVPAKNVFILLSANDGPVWAYRLSPEIPPPRPDAGVVPRDGGMPGVDGGGSPDGGGGDAGGGASGDGGCGCRVASHASSPASAWAIVVLGAILMFRRRRGSRRSRS